MSWRSESVPIYLFSMTSSSLKTCNSTFARSLVFSKEVVCWSNSAMLLEWTGGPQWVNKFYVLMSQNVKEIWRETVRKAAPRSLYTFHTVVLISVSRLSKIWRCTSGLGPTNDMACESCAKILRFARYLIAAQKHAAKTSESLPTPPLPPRRVSKCIDPYYLQIFGLRGTNNGKQLCIL